MAGIGTGTGVDLRWYSNLEYIKLDSKKKKELDDWRKTPAGELATKKLREDAAKEKSSQDPVLQVVIVMIAMTIPLNGKRSSRRLLKKNKQRKL